MADDLLTWQLNKARVLLSQGDAYDSYMLLQGLSPQALKRDNAFAMQFFSTLSEAAKRLGWYNSSVEWLMLSLSFGERDKAFLEEQIRESEEAGLVVR